MTSLTGKRSCVTAIIALSIVITVLCSACHTPAPGTVVDKNLVLAESFLIEGSSDPYFVAFTLGQDLWIVGEDQLIRRYPDGRRDLLQVPVDARDAHVRTGQREFYILEPRIGRLRSFDADGKVLWQVDDLGMVHDVAWKRDKVYALSYPDPFSQPPVIEVVLHSLRLSDGNLTSNAVELPEGIHWEPFAGVGKSSAKLMDADSTVCLYYVAYDDVTGQQVHFLAVPAESCGFRIILRGWTKKATVLGDIFAYLTREDEKVLVAHDLETGERLWRLELDTGESVTGVPFVTAAGGVIILFDGGIDWTRARGLDPETGEVLWTWSMPFLPDRAVSLAEDVIVSYGNSALRLTSTGRTKWELSMGAPIDVLSLDEPGDRLSLAVDLYGCGVEEVTVSLTDGTVLDRACGQAGYRYIAHSIPVPKIERTTGEGPSKDLMYLEGRYVPIADPVYIQPYSKVFAREDFVLAACKVESGKVKVYLLRPRGNAQ